MACGMAKERSASEARSFMQFCSSQTLSCRTTWIVSALAMAQIVGIGFPALTFWFFCVKAKEQFSQKTNQAN
jgi:hypothetical protein